MKKIKKKLKKSEEYPLISFRIEEDTKESVLERINIIKDRIDAKNNGEFYKVKKKDIFAEALEIGLTKLLRDNNGKWDKIFRFI